ncbi:hypothetical protein GCM10010912_29620 [Paenibacillus albidus]|uniref:Uncharacterized protein n=1 Tax=Paenibacillus albidus TaxID=2041023 RepID=A0A917CCY0_9BACL|nr:hypothetical protein [Paenibacillus albidus]GGF82589.1 hypothetical protein GCM10010912_29620 [Paenibacillus albidus]
MGQYLFPGNATPSDVLTGKKFSAGTLYNANGTIINKSVENHHMPSTQSTVWAGDRVFLQPPEGYYNGQTWVTVPAPNLRPEYILSGRGFSDMAGTVPVISTGDDVALSAGQWSNGDLAVYPREGYRKGGAGAGEIKVTVAQMQAAGINPLRRYDANVTVPGNGGVDVPVPITTMKSAHTVVVLYQGKVSVSLAQIDGNYYYTHDSATAPMYIASAGMENGTAMYPVTIFLKNRSQLTFTVTVVFFGTP